MYLEAVEHPHDAGGVEPPAGRGAHHLAELRQRRAGGPQRPRLGELRSHQHRGLAQVRGGEQPLEPELELLQEGARVARPRQAIELVELPVLALPERSRLRRRVSALGPHRGLETIGQARHPQEPRGPEVGEQVLRAAAEHRGADERQQPATDRGVAEGHRAVDRVRDPVGAEHLLEQR